VTRVCRVLPDVPAVGRAFDYLVPDGLGEHLRVGTVVRVPLHGRRVRGWVLADDVVPETERERLLPIRAVVSAGPPPELVDLCAWAAWRWAGPVAALLRAATPARAVSPGPDPEPDAAVYPPAAPPLALPDVRVRVIRWPPARPRLGLVRALVSSEGSTILVAPDRHELASLRDAL
jgi:primosomal protein N' (replication factor Y) (superfamily II helicase)